MLCVWLFAENIWERVKNLKNREQSDAWLSIVELSF